jgi:type VI secretion system secreted protein VgrG
MAKYTQSGQALAVTTPLGDDALLLEKFSGHEALSELFHFQLDMLVPKGTAIPFEALLGQAVTVAVRHRDGSRPRHFHGIVSSLSQGAQVHGEEHDTFTQYQAEVVPAFWFLSRNRQSRIFQSISVPDILRKVLVDEWQLDVTFQLTGKYYPRDHCVQYQESDFAFASRLMEEEGIFYFFEHTADGHRMVVSDTPQAHPDIPDVQAVLYDEQAGGVREQERVHRWVKRQEVRAGKVTLWDHSFEVPASHLDAQAGVAGRTVSLGKVSHPLQVGGNQKLELYDFPGEYAKRFDGINPYGSDRPEDLRRIYEDNRRTAAIRIEQEAVAGFAVSGASTCWHFVAGHKFNLQRHFDADGTYVLTRVEHAASIEGSYTTGKKDAAGVYENKFSGIPFATSLPFRPQRVTPRPKIEGPQTAVVTVLPGDDHECFLDKYGRVKVQFHWDRQGKNDVNSSCWVRVAQVWAGQKWGAFFWPRKGHEVVVAFEEGDPDRPLIIGSVYNAANLPPLEMPKTALINGFKSCTYRKTAAENFNALFFIDQPGNEHVAFHSERNMTFDAELDKLVRAGRHQHDIVPDSHHLVVGGLPIPGGGSGGGSPTPPAPTAATGPNPWDWQETDYTQAPSAPAPPPTAYTWNPPAAVPLGMSSQVVYGDNICCTSGVYDMVTVGESITTTINPLSILAAAIPMPAFAGLLGGLFAGNVSFTFGTSTTVQLGQQFQVSLGPGQVTMDATNHAPSTILACLIAAANLAWQVAYGATQDFSRRNNIHLICQGVIEALLVALVEVELGYKTGQQTFAGALKGLFQPGAIEIDAQEDPLKMEEVTKKVKGMLKKAVKGLQTEDDVEAKAKEIMKKGTVTAGIYEVQADHIRLMSTPCTVPPTATKHFLTLFAPGNGTNGNVSIRGSQGVRITAGPPDPLLPRSKATDGIEVIAGLLTGGITLQAGDPATGPRVKMGPNNLEITGVGPIAIQSDTELTLSVSGGMAKITLKPDGITIEGLQIKQLAQLQAELQTLENKVTATINQIASTLQQYQ